MMFMVKVKVTLPSGRKQVNYYGPYVHEEHAARFADLAHDPVFKVKATVYCLEHPDEAYDDHGEFKAKTCPNELMLIREPEDEDELSVEEAHVKKRKKTRFNPLEN